MCFGSSKTKTDSNSTSAATTANTAASAPTNPTIDPAITNEVNAATSLASQPLQQYTGSLVAPLTDTQNEAIGEIQGAQGTAQPYLTKAASLADQGATPITTTPFSSDAVNQYLSPYLSDVLSSTQAAEKLQDEQQQQSLAGGITAAGAFGGDRQAVVQSELAGQQDTANNVTNSGIENQGYSDALNEFNTENQLNYNTQQANNSNSLAASNAYGNIGLSAQTAALNGANSLFNAGTAEQQVNQENLNVPYEQYLQQQAFPYQQLDFESGILGSAAGTSGTTTNQNGSTSGSSTGTNAQSTSTPLGPELLGLGLGAAALLKSGGRARLADGGTSDAFALPTPMSLASYIPVDSSSSAKGLQPLSVGNGPSGPALPGGGGGGTGGSGGSSSPLGGADAGQGLANIYNSLSGGSPSFASGLASNAGYGGFSPGYMAGVGEDIGSGVSGDLAGLSDILPALPVKTGGRTRLADGGIGDDADAGSDFDALLAKMSQSDAESASAAAPVAQAPAGASAMSLADTPPAWRSQATNYADAPAQPTSLAAGPTWDDGTPVVAQDDEGEAPDAPPASLASAAAQPTAPSGSPGLGTAYAPKILQNAYTPKADWRRALLTAGTSMMAAHGGNGLSNVGAGLQAGANEYYNQVDKDNNPTVDHSGPTTLVRYADGTVVDTGLPTEAALNAKASNDYKFANMATVNQTRQDAIEQRAQAAKDAVAERAAAAQAAVAERAAAAKEAAANRTLMLQIAQSNANAGRYGQPIAGQGTDPTSGKQVPGVYVTNTKTGEPEFHAGVVLTQKDMPGGSDAQLKPEAIPFYGEQLARGDTSVLQNLGRGPIASKNAIAIRNAAYDYSVAHGIDPSAAMSAVAEFTGQKAAERVLGTTSARIGLGASELQQLIPQALDASKALPRSQFPTANSVMQAFQSGSGDPRVRDLGIALQAAKGAYSQVLTRGGMPTDSARATADELFATKDPETVLQTAMQRVQKETAAIRQAPGMVRQDLRNDARGQVSSTAQPSKYQEGQILHQGGNLYKVVNGQPVYQGKAN